MAETFRNSRRERARMISVTAGKATGAGHCRRRRAASESALDPEGCLTRAAARHSDRCIPRHESAESSPMVPKAGPSSFSWTRRQMAESTMMRTRAREDDAEKSKRTKKFAVRLLHSGASSTWKGEEASLPSVRDSCSFTARRYSIPSMRCSSSVDKVPQSDQRFKVVDLTPSPTKC